MDIAGLAGYFEKKDGVLGGLEHFDCGSARWTPFVGQSAAARFGKS